MYVDTTQGKLPDFRGNNLDFLFNLNHETILSGPYQTGKTFSSMYKLHSLLCLNEKTIALVARKTYKSLVQSVIPTYENKILNGNLEKMGIEKFGGIRPTEYVYPNGSKIILGGLDNPDKVLSAEYDYIYVNQAEEVKLNAWEILVGRATGRAGNTKTPLVFGDANPAPPNHWILSRSAIDHIKTRHEDNPTLHDGKDWTTLGKKTIEILSSLTGVRRKRGFLGEWVAAEGTVYESEYDPDRHLISSNQVPVGCAYFMSMDFGIRSPLVIQLWAVDRLKNMYLVREIYYTGKTVYDYRETLERWRKQYGAKTIVCDHDVEGMATLRRLGYKAVLAKKSIVTGINQVKDLLNQTKLFICHDALEKIDEKLFPNPNCTAEEFLSYVYPDGEKNMFTDLPEDKNNHGMDAMRYAVMSIVTG